MTDSQVTPTPETRTFTAEENVARIRHVIETIWNAYDWAAAREYYAPDIYVHEFAGLEPIRGFQAWEETFERLHQAFPDLHFALEDIYGVGDRVAARWTVTGTQRGDFMDTPPTGRSVAWKQLTMFRLENGRAAEIWPMPDMLGLFRALGMSPPKALMAVMRRLRRIRGRLSRQR
jgi:steroid delta-isomerase-like uncharacterized protein